MTLSLNDLYRIYHDTEAFVRHYPALEPAFRPVAARFAEKMRKPDASIMVYGVYNAGKSTLINALLGAETAPTGDFPLTDRVDEYRWGQYAILDTPGVDAPLDHEKVTQQQMLNVDAIVFVVNPSGAAEEMKTLQVMIDLLAQGKKLFLVFNEKEDFSVELFTRLKNSTRMRLQELAAAKGMDVVLADIPIWRVNAQRALDGKLRQKPGLIEYSGYPAFETALTGFIDSITPDDISKQLAHSLNNFLDTLLASLMQNSGDDAVRQYNTLLKNLLAAQAACQREVNKEIARNRLILQTRSKTALQQDPQHCQQTIGAIYHEAVNNVNRVLTDETAFLSSQFAQDVQALEAALAGAPHHNNVQVQGIQPGTDETMPANKGLLDKVNADAVKGAVGTVGSVAKPEHVVAGLKLVKEWLPSVMKGIGPKTMEKWGTLVVGKWIPYVGTAVTVISTLWDMVAEDPQEKRLREQSEHYARERERFMQEVEDISRDIAAKFEKAMADEVRDILTPWFTEMTQKVTATLDVANSEMQANRDALTQAQRLSDRLADA